MLFRSYNPSFRDERGGTVYSLKELTKKDINDADLVVITTDHTNLDYEMIAENAKYIFDTKNATAKVKNNRDKIELL